VPFAWNVIMSKDAAGTEVYNWFSDHEVWCENKAVHQD
jgi:hypothetical protein